MKGRKKQPERLRGRKLRRVLRQVWASQATQLEELRRMVRAGVRSGAFTKDEATLADGDLREVAEMLLGYLPARRKSV